MASKWREITVDEIKSSDKGSIAIGPFGSRMKSDCYVPTGIPVIRGTNLNGGPIFEGDFVYITKEKADELGSSNVYENDLVFPHRGSIGEVGIVIEKKRYVLSSSLMKLTCDPNKANAKFIYYFFKSQIGRHELLKNSSQVGTPGIGQPLSSLKSITLKLPDLESQSKIAQVLFSLDEKILVNTRINQTLEEIAQAIFKSWFVDFDPVKAKAQIIDQGGSEQDANLAAMEVISGKTRDQLAALQKTHPEHYTQLHTTATLFPSAFVDSELGEIPEGWEICSSSNFGNIVCGKTPSKSSQEFYGSDYPFIKIPDMHGNAVITKTGEYLSSKGSDSQIKKLIPRGSICVSCIATVGLVSITTEDSHTNQQINSIVPDKNYYSFFLYFTFKNLYKHLHDLASGGSATLNMNTGTFSKIALVKPQAQLIECFHEIVAPLFSKIESQAKQITHLNIVRDALLPKLLSGEIDVSQLNLEA